MRSSIIGTLVGLSCLASGKLIEAIVIFGGVHVAKTVVEWMCLEDMLYVSAPVFDKVHLLQTVLCHQNSNPNHPAYQEYLEDLHKLNKMRAASLMKHAKAYFFGVRVVGTVEDRDGLISNSMCISCGGQSCVHPCNTWMLTLADGYLTLSSDCCLLFGFRPFAAIALFRK